MNTHRRALLTVLLIALSGRAGRASRAADISGAWSFSVDVGDSHGDPTFVFTQEGEQLTGTVSNAQGQQRVTGTVKGDTAVFGFEATRDGRTVKATYTGTVESPTKMTGTVEISGALNGTGTWAATRK